MAAARVAFDLFPRDAHDTRLSLYTSGTPPTPRAAELTHLNHVMKQSSSSHTHSAPRGRDQVFLAALPLVHVVRQNWRDEPNVSTSARRSCRCPGLSRRTRSAMLRRPGNASLDPPTGPGHAVRTPVKTFARRISAVRCSCKACERRLGDGRRACLRSCPRRLSSVAILEASASPETSPVACVKPRQAASARRARSGSRSSGSRP
jgi:hypothetical protein